jgi:hypothetical protein
MRNRSAAAVFYILSVLLFPVTLIGYVIWVGKGIFTGHASGVSATAQGPLSARWFEHNLGAREDEPANRLMKVLPGVPPLGLRLVAGPTLLAHRVTGYVPKAFRRPFEGDIPPQYQASARVAFFDNAVDRFLDDITQPSSSAQVSTRARSDCPRTCGPDRSRSTPRKRRQSSARR